MAFESRGIKFIMAGKQNSKWQTWRRSRKLSDHVFKCNACPQGHNPSRKAIAHKHSQTMSPNGDELSKCLNSWREELIQTTAQACAIPFSLLMRNFKYIVLHCNFLPFNNLAIYKLLYRRRINRFLLQLDQSLIMV